MDNGFCGWYFRCQSAQHALAIIPAIHIRKGERSCSLQLITEEKAWNVPLPFQGVWMRRRVPEAALGGSVFSRAGIHLDVQGQDFRADGNLRFGPPAPLRGDIMGPFRYVPFMECRHSVFSMCHRVDGTVRINDQTYVFADGAGYIEGDRGRSFPRRYAWTQCSFPGGSLMLSVADIPLGTSSFTGTIGVVWLKGKEYRLATYFGARVVKIADGEMVVRQGKYTLKATRLEAAARSLHAPHRGEMSRTIRENVACRARYQFARGKEILLDLYTAGAAFEFEYDHPEGGEEGRGPGAEKNQEKF